MDVLRTCKVPLPGGKAIMNTGRVPSEGIHKTKLDTYDVWGKFS